MVKRIKLRTLFIGGCITLFFLVLLGRVFWIQVLDRDFWQTKAAKQWAHTSVFKAVRGTIEDRNGRMLASDVPAYTVVVNPEAINALSIGEKLSPAYMNCSASLRMSLRRSWKPKTRTESI